MGHTSITMTMRMSTTTNMNMTMYMSTTTNMTITCIHMADAIPSLHDDAIDAEIIDDEPEET